MADVYFQEGSSILPDEGLCSEGDDGLDNDSMTVKDGNGSDQNEYGVETSLMANADDLLPPVPRLLKYVESEIIFHRQVVARNILETLRSVLGNDEEIAEVTGILCRLMNDAETCVRCELMEQIPHIASFCHEHTSLAPIIPQHILPTMMKYLTDSYSQVRKGTQAALLVMVEQGLIERCLIEEMICPIIVQLTGIEYPTDQRFEALSLMSKMATLLGKEMTEYYFLPKFTELCTDQDQGLRKACVDTFSELCGVVGRDTTEKILWPKFCYMCEDTSWSVRKACPDAMVAMSCICSMQARHQYLAPMYLNLLTDTSKWVQLDAYHALGPFISTFADPTRTGIYYTEEGTLITLAEVTENLATEFNKTSLEDPEKSDDMPGKPPPDKTELRSDSNSNSLEDSCLDQQELPGERSQTTSESPPTVIDAPLSSPVDVGGDSHTKTNKLDNQAQSPNGQLPNQGEQEPLDSCDTTNATPCTLPVNNPPSSLETNPVDSSSLRPQLDCLSSSVKLCNVPRKDGSPDSPLTVTAKHGHLCVHIDSESAFNAFQFWRIPIPDLQLDIDIKEGGATSVHVKAKIHDDLGHQVYASNLSVKVTSPQKEGNQSIANEMYSELGANMAVPTKDISGKCEASKEGSEASQNADISKVHVQAVSLSTVSDLDYSRNKSKSRVRVISSSCNEADVTLHGKELGDVMKARLNLFSPETDSSLQSFKRKDPFAILPQEIVPMAPGDQDIVPSGLLEHYLKMIDPLHNQVLDGDLVHFCAFSFPGVALTLGRHYWLCIKQVYETLASNMQWKVRWTLACSLHEVATILGSELTARDLLPVFIGFLRDLDEVRVGVLQHLYQFLKVVPPSERTMLLSRLGEFLKVDNDKNWRFRFMLAEQLIPIIEICSPLDVKDFLLPVGLALIRDKVAEVRRFSIRVVAVMVRRISQSPDPNVVKYLLVELAERLTRSSKWLERQTYALLCQFFLIESSIPLEQFASEILPHLLYLCWDGVPNVRLAVARCLTETLLCIDFFLSNQNPHQQLVMQALQTLQIDPDNDVQYFARLCPPEGGLMSRNKDPLEYSSKSGAELIQQQRDFLFQRTRYYLDKLLNSTQETV